MQAPLRRETAAAVLALRELVTAIAAARDDSADFLAVVTHGGLRIVLDESSRTLSIGIALGDGPVEWVEAVSVDVYRQDIFGVLASSTSAGAEAFGTEPTLH